MALLTVQRQPGGTAPFNTLSVINVIEDDDTTLWQPYRNGVSVACTGETATISIQVQRSPVDPAVDNSLVENFGAPITGDATDGLYAVLEDIGTWYYAAVVSGTGEGDENTITLGGFAYMNHALPEEGIV